MDCTPIAPTRIAAASRLCAISLDLRRFGNLRASTPATRNPRHCAPWGPESYLLLQRAEDTVSQATFLHRQPPYLRPDPTRAIRLTVNPTTEPPELNPTNITRPHHILHRVLPLD